MDESTRTLYVGLDVHKESIAAGARIVRRDLGVG